MSTRKTIAALVLILASATSFAADKALIVAVGEYALDRINDLPGIDLDADMMYSTAQLMGFSRNNIKVLKDEQATYANVADAMLKWLSDVGPNDRVMIYLGGHGTLIKDYSGDETGDQKDEALVLHDAGIEGEYNGEKTNGIMLDELIGQLLDKIPSNNIMVFVDACHSGTPTRSLTEDPSFFGDSELFPKFANLENELDVPPVANKSGGTVLKSASDRYVVMSAAKDDESAIATSRGSIFTISVAKSIRKAMQSNQPITPEKLITEARTYVRANVSAGKVFSPQLSGNETRFRKPLPVVSLQNGASEAPGTEWTKLSEMVDQLKAKYGAIGMSTNARSYRLGQDVEISVNVPTEGYLNVVTVDSKDNNVVLFPNRYHENNKVSAGNLRIPTSQMDFTLPVSEPLGQTLVVAFLSDRPISFYKSQVGGERDSTGNYIGDFAEVSPAATRAISVVPKERPTSWVRATKVVVSTTR